tara:strand:+ start:4922 stop:5521 length:600 start_codon:yes stop_codon:yes gene_type:complete
MSTNKVRTRCKKGTRKNKKTGLCESVLDNTCSICLDRVISGNVKTKCKHNFHKKCLIGWCKSQSHIEAPQCPICRGNIKDTCKKIMPFDSQEVFRYTGTIYGRSDQFLENNLERMNEIIHNPRFDVNVKNFFDESLLYELSWNKNDSNRYKPIVEYLLKHPKIIVDVKLITTLIANNNQTMISLYKKHKKIPNHLKNLI